MTKREKWLVAIIIIVILAFAGLAALYRNQQVRQTLCTLRCQRIEDDAAWEACIGECLVEIANDQ